MINTIKLMLLGSILLTTQVINAQTKIGGTAGAGDASSVLELQSTSQGFLPPRMTTVQRDAIVNPAEGLMIYNTGEHCVDIYKGSVGGWYNTCSAGGGMSFTNCGTAVTGTLTAQTAISGVSVTLNYVNNTGQTSGTFYSGVANGVSFTAASGTVIPLPAGGGSITLTAAGTPTAAGTVNIPIILSGTACSIPITIGPFLGNIPVACGTAPGCTGGIADASVAVAGNKICWGGFTYTAIAAGGRIWLDRNLGATEVATSASDVAAYGDMYQWGRKGDGHQCTIYSVGGSSNGGTSAGSTTNSIAATTASPNNNIFYMVGGDWHLPSIDTLWSGSATGGTNNPCPLGWRVPTQSEYTSLFTTSGPWPFTTLNEPLGGYRDGSSGSTGNTGTYGMLWTSTSIATTTTSYFVMRDNSNNFYYSGRTSQRSAALPIRCIKN